MVSILPDPKTKVECLRAALSWDLAHEYTITNKGLHLRHVEGTYICGAEIDDPLIETTPHGGVDLCNDCATSVPEYVKWKEPEPHSAHKLGWNINQLCKAFDVKLLLANDRPNVNDVIAAPCGALLGDLDKRELYVGEQDGNFLDVHRVSALHEVVHLVAARYGAFQCESACGFYAVQYALALCMENPKPLLKSTHAVLSTDCPVFGGLLQARAFAVGLLDDTRNFNFSAHLPRKDLLNP